MSVTTGGDDIPTDSTPEYYGEYYGERTIPEEESVVLNSEDFISGPFRSDKCTIHNDILEMDYSYGYDCMKHFNLVAPDKDTIVWIGGNIIHFLDVKSGTLSFRRSYLGGGIGHIAVNPNPDYPHFTVAENGDHPPIIIYEWPTLEIVGILKDGAAKRYAHINYSPDGELLVSQSCAPDFLITVWVWKNWKTSGITLRTKSHVTDVFTCMFSPYVPGQISTGGSGHIKFWKMANTFTGLKLKGELGRFGKTEISDIVGLFPMPDEKVISGTEWGNLLVWEAGLIKIEVMRTMRRTCHEGPIMQIEYIRDRDEIWTISHDGWMRAWEYRIIDEADPPDEDRVVQMIPSYERQIQGVKFQSFCKRHLYDPENMHYFAQDANGGIWLVDMELTVNYESPKRLKACHAGKIVDMATCPWGPYIISLGEGGKICLHNYDIRKTVFHYKFNAKGVGIIWFPLTVDPTGTFFLSGFDDGVVRVFLIDFQNPKSYNVKVTQSVKPHSKPITAITLNPAGTIFVTGGEDGCVFIFQVVRALYVQLQPIGFVPISATPSCFTWYPEKETVCLVGCKHGELFEFNFPTHPLPYTKISYLLHTIKPIKQRFTTCKSEIRRDLQLAEIERQKEEKIIRKKKEIEKIKAEGLDVDEEQYLQDSEEEEVLEPLHIPEVPNPIFFMVYTPEDTIWVSMGGYDAGYIYEYHMDQKQKKPLKATIICDGDDIEMHGLLYSPAEDFVITSMQDGSIRINRVNQEDFRDLSDYWQLPMHDNYNGRITKMCFSYDKKYFFSCGEDGNLFSYVYNTEHGTQVTHSRVPKTKPVPPIKTIEVDLNYGSLSLEEVMIKAEEDKQLKLANEHKRKLRLRLKELTEKLNCLLDRNCKLPSSQRYPLRQLIVDDRIMKALDNELDAKVALEKRKLAYDVEKSTVAMNKMKKYYTDCLDVYPIEVQGINIPYSADILVSRTLGEKFHKMFNTVEEKMQEEHLKGRLPPRQSIVIESLLDSKKKEEQIEPFLVGLSPSTIAFKLGYKLTRLLGKYRARKRYQEERQVEWNSLLSAKPVEGANHPVDQKETENAKHTIGDFKLKSSKNYRVPAHLRETTVAKYKQLLEARLKACKLILRTYNGRVLALRDKKIKLIDKIKYKRGLVANIHQEIPESRILQPPPIPVMQDEEFAEKYIETKLTVEEDFKIYLESLKPKKEPKPSEMCKFTDWEREVYGLTTLPEVPGDCRDIINYLISTSEINFTPYGREIPEVDDLKSTYWDKEIEYRRLLRKIHDQRTLINEMNQAIQDFDEEVAELYFQRFKITMQISYLEMHILVLNQELTIIRDVEVVEIKLSDIAFQKWNEMMDQRDNMKRIETKIEAYNFNIDGYQEAIKVVQQSFLTAAKDNKFWDFLRRIFKKKYRPPKLATDSDSSSMSSESSSDSDDDEDTGSLDSRDVGPIRLDENICPKGCDRELYDYTFALRTKRHELEILIKEAQKSIEMCKKEMDQAAKSVKMCEQTNKKAQDDLDDYQTLKQQKLNEVNCTVLLTLRQLQHLNPDGHSVAKLADTLVFNVPVRNTLYSRVNELKKETLEQQTLYRKNKIHLQRMTMDCKYMTNKIAELKQEIREKMILKFGSIVKVDDIEEAILKRMVLNLRISMLNIGKMYEKDVEALRVLYGEKQIELKNLIRENTARLEVIAILNKEKRELGQILEKTATAKDRLKRGDQTYFTKDIDKLQAIVKKQNEQIETLKAEIKTLNTKSLPPEPIQHEEVPVKEVVLSGDFGSLEELYDPSNYLPQKDEELLAKYFDEGEVTEDELVLCIHELIQEVIDTVMASDKSEDEKLVAALSEIVDQVPMEYLEKRKSVQFLAGLIKDMVEGVIHVSSESITKVAKATQRSVDEIAGYIEEIINTLNGAPEDEYEEDTEGFEDLLQENWIIQEEFENEFESKTNSVNPDELD